MLVEGEKPRTQKVQTKHRIFINKYDIFWIQHYPLEVKIIRVESIISEV